ncbi:MAG TPA: TIGR00375 family protein, partial [Firmicutes bacterium]|nr:TIGR00375 family protein [Bacillota bacterium]
MQFYGDLHIHIGRTSRGEPVKITGSKHLTIENIFRAAEFEKGLDLIGIVDAACSGVMSDLTALIEQGKLKTLENGGLRLGKTTLFLGSEVELAHGPRAAHFLAFFPTLEKVRSYARALKPYLTNPSLSTQRLKTSADHWLEIVKKNRGVALAAHAFTPHKGVYGSCVSRLGEMFARPADLAGLELGLSGTTKMAAEVSDTHQYPYISNSDAHSLAAIGREFTVYDLPGLNFESWRQALAGKKGAIARVHGLEPALGKYFRSFCPRCQWTPQEKTPYFTCPHCDGAVIFGVWDRLKKISDYEGPLTGRPPYITHVPLLMLPGVGQKTYRKMITHLGPEIKILYEVPLAEI